MVYQFDSLIEGYQQLTAGDVTFDVNISWPTDQEVRYNELQEKMSIYLRNISIKKYQGVAQRITDFDSYYTLASVFHLLLSAWITAQETAVRNHAVSTEDRASLSDLVSRINNYMYYDIITMESFIQQLQEFHSSIQTESYERAVELLDDEFLDTFTNWVDSLLPYSYIEQEMDQLSASLVWHATFQDVNSDTCFNINIRDGALSPLYGLLYRIGVTTDNTLDGTVLYIEVLDE